MNGWEGKGEPGRGWMRAMAPIPNPFLKISVIQNKLTALSLTLNILTLLVKGTKNGARFIMSFALVPSITAWKNNSKKENERQNILVLNGPKDALKILA